MNRVKRKISITKFDYSKIITTFALQLKILAYILGEMAEWSIAAVLKTVELERFRGFESLSLRRTYWTEMVSERTKSYKSMICGFFYCPKVLLPSDAKECILTICYPISLEYCL